jgi:hypothetical protein
MNTLAIIGIFIGAVICPRLVLGIILFSLGEPILGSWALMWALIVFFND